MNGEYQMIGTTRLDLISRKEGSSGMKAFGHLLDEIDSQKHTM
jgi:hypothetical protein